MCVGCVCCGWMDVFVDWWMDGWMCTWVGIMSNVVYSVLAACWNLESGILMNWWILLLWIWIRHRQLEWSQAGSQRQQKWPEMSDRSAIMAGAEMALRAEPGSWQVSAKDNGAEPCRLSAKARPTQEHCWASAWPERLSAEGQRHFTLHWGSPRQFGAEVPATSAWGKSVLGRHAGRAQRRCGWHWLISISFTSSLFINACTICFVCNMVNITDLGRIF